LYEFFAFLSDKIEVGVEFFEMIDPRVLFGDERKQHVLGAHLFMGDGIVLKGKFLGKMNYALGVGRVVDFHLRMVEITAEHVAVCLEPHARAAQNFIRLAIFHDQHGKNEVFRADVKRIILLCRFGRKLHDLF